MSARDSPGRVSLAWNARVAKNKMMTRPTRICARYSSNTPAVWVAPMNSPFNKRSKWWGSTRY